jgi:transmembrane sensor
VKRPARSRFNTQIYEEACEWFVECRAGDLDKAARAAFDRWLRKSPEHQSAYLEISAIWNEGPDLDPSNRWDLDKLIVEAAEDPANIVALERARSDAPPPTSGRVSVAAAPAGRRRLLAIAASVLLTTAALAAYILTPSGVYATALGEQRSFALSDGSTVQLNSLSKIRIRYSAHERTVDLLRGEALFHVAKDATRPFSVRSGQTAVRAVGTQFDVYRKVDGTIVTVVEGRVAILRIPDERAAAGDSGPARSNEGHPSVLRGEGEQNLRTLAPGAAVPDVAQRDGEGAIFLTAGEQITVSTNTVRKTLNPSLAGATSWTQRQLVFETASLADVAEEFNRYNERKLVIDPSVLGALHISGVFSSTDPASLSRFLRDRPDLRVIETPTEIRVERVQ